MAAKGECGLWQACLGEPPDAGLDTRMRLLLAAFEEMHRHGFQAASLNRILERAGVTKGALYHHFRSKQALGLAVLEELIGERLHAVWVAPLQEGDPIERLISVIETAGGALTEEDIRLGCPLNNLAQEMAPIDEAFRCRIEILYRRWREGVADALRRGRREGTVRREVDPESTAVFIVAALEGCLGLAKNAQDPGLLVECGNGLIRVLRDLRPAREGERGA